MDSPLDSSNEARVWMHLPQPPPGRAKVPGRDLPLPKELIPVGQKTLGQQRKTSPGRLPLLKPVPRELPLQSSSTVSNESKKEKKTLSAEAIKGVQSSADKTPSLSLAQAAAKAAQLRAEKAMAPLLREDARKKGAAYNTLRAHLEVEQKKTSLLEAEKALVKKQQAPHQGHMEAVEADLWKSESRQQNIRNAQARVIMGSPLEEDIRALRNHLSALRNEKKELEKTKGPKHHQAEELQRQIDVYDTQIRELGEKLKKEREELFKENK